MNRIDLAAFAQLAPSLRKPWHDGYYAMYSSVLGGVVTEPALMTLPLDDHMAHRGDAVFEAMKFVDGGIYNLRPHIERLRRSADAIALALPVSLDDMERIIVETACIGNRREGYVRLFVSRGPGGFDANPYAVCGSQLYVAITAMPPSFMEQRPEGARAGVSSIPPKSPMYARVKSCNYLPNALMKKEAVDRGLDLVVAFDEQGFMREGSTENVGLVNEDGVLTFPDPDRMLRGTTMLRVMELAKDTTGADAPTDAVFRETTRADIERAREMLIVGTTWDVSMVCQFEGKPIGDGRPGPVYRALRERLLEDIRTNTALRTTFGTEP